MSQSPENELPPHEPDSEKDGCLAIGLKVVIGLVVVFGLLVGTCFLMVAQ